MGQTKYAGCLTLPLIFCRPRRKMQQNASSKEFQGWQDAGIANEGETAQKILEEKERESRTRRLTGPMGAVLSLLLIAFSLFQMYASVLGTLDAMTLRATHIIFLFVIAALIYPALKKERRVRSIPTVWDMFCIAGIAYSFGYLIVRYDELAMSGGWFTTQDYIASGIGIAVSFEMARRVVPNLAWFAMKNLSLEGAVTDLAGIPIHPGAEHYYREIGAIK